MKKRFTALRVIGTIYKVLGGITGAATILIVLGLCATSVLGGAAINNLGREFGSDSGFLGLFSGVFGGLLLSVVAIVYGGGLAVTLYAAGEGVYLLLGLEENTRETVILLRQQGNNEVNAMK
ncbi:MAG: hypothetical protein U1B80_05195 [Anaerolineaceae bacterium]|nr:hypothetical protein [Anaerolineaceae bacterium]